MVNRRSTGGIKCLYDLRVERIRQTGVDESYHGPPATLPSDLRGAGAIHRYRQLLFLMMEAACRCVCDGHDIARGWSSELWAALP